MRQALEKNVISRVAKVLNEEYKAQHKFDFLLNTHLLFSDKKTRDVADCAFRRLGGNFKGLQVKRTMKLPVDAYFLKSQLVVEIDELQHFTEYRLKTLDIMKEKKLHNTLGFNLEEYLKYCFSYKELAIKKGQSGYRKPKKEFNFENGRAAQRAYFDLLRDLFIFTKLGKPVIRFSQFEVENMTDEELEGNIKIKLSRISS